jgi:hypothetical protein
VAVEVTPAGVAALQEQPSPNTAPITQQPFTGQVLPPGFQPPLPQVQPMVETQPAMQLPQFPSATPAAIPHVEGPGAQSVTGHPSLEDLQYALGQLDANTRTGAAFSLLRKHNQLMAQRVPPEMRQTIIAEALNQIAASPT